MVLAALEWVEAYDRRMEAGRVKRQFQDYGRGYLASAAVTEAKRLERAALRELHLAVKPKAIKARSREVLELVQLGVTHELE